MLNQGASFRGKVTRGLGASSRNRGKRHVAPEEVGAIGRPVPEHPMHKSKPNDSEI
jgi:hypothetical protein